MKKVTRNEQLLVDRVSIVDYYNTHIVPMGKKFKPMGEGRITAICPFHHDTDPSFHYWKKKNLFHCFGCGKGGNVVRLHMLFRQMYYNERMSKDKAVESLAVLYNITLYGVEEERKSIFQKAREVLTDDSYYALPQDRISLSQFTSYNNKIISSSASLDSKIGNFVMLDLLMSLQLYEE